MYPIVEMAQSCKLSKAITDAAIPRKVRATCELIAGNRHYFVRGDDGKPASRVFSTPDAFARFIKTSYGLRGAGVSLRGSQRSDLRPLEPELIEVNSDYLRTATDLRPLVTGKKADRILGYGGQWTGKIVGTDPETGSQVTVAWYDHPYEKTADAKKRASQLLQYVKAKR